MPIFTRTYDLLAWLLPATNQFPREYRHTVTRRLVDAALDLRERLEEANRPQSERVALLEEGGPQPLRRFRRFRAWRSPP